MSFAAASHFAQTWGLVLLAALFAAVVAYAMWPANRATFERAARAPLHDDKDEDDGRQT